MICLLAQVNIRHTIMQTSFCISSNCSNTKQQFREREREWGGRTLKLHWKQRSQENTSKLEFSPSVPTWGSTADFSGACVVRYIKENTKSIFMYRPRYPGLQKPSRANLSFPRTFTESTKRPTRKIRQIVNVPENIELSLLDTQMFPVYKWLNTRFFLNKTSIKL